jgi:hypothetical protein
MNRIYAKGFAFAVITAVLGSGCIYIETVDGSGDHATERRVLESFDELEVNGIFDRVTVEVCDCEPVAIISGDDNLLAEVELDSDDGELRVEAEDWLSPRLDLEVKLRTRNLEKLELNGVGSVSVGGVFADSFEAQNNGVGSMSLRGEARTVDLENSGTGRIDASRLAARTAKAKADGTGDLEVCATHKLEAKVSGTGSVFFSCEPATIEKKISGTGEVRPR